LGGIGAALMTAAIAVPFGALAMTPERALTATPTATVAQAIIVRPPLPTFTPTVAVINTPVATRQVQNDGRLPDGRLDPAAWNVWLDLPGLQIGRR